MPTFRAFAKINLGLQVLGKRSDGYHSISTVFHRIDLHDEISIEPATSLEVFSTSHSAPGGESNLCHKAALEVQRQLAVQQGFRIHITKNIPVGAGLGGGSSDAATVLRELPRLMGRHIDDAALHSLALKLGSDVPYFLKSGTASGTGRGEILEYFTLNIPYFILVCYPHIHVSTAWAYQGFSEIKSRPVADFKQILIDGIKNPKRMQELTNDFEEHVFQQHPDIALAKQMMLKHGAIVSLMSGSGSSVFGLFASMKQAEEASAIFKEKQWFVSLTQPGFSPS